MDCLPPWKGDRTTGRDRTVAAVEASQSCSLGLAAVAHGVSRLVFAAGACPLDESGAIVSVGDVVAQAERVMTNLRIALQAAEADHP